MASEILSVVYFLLGLLAPAVVIHRLFLWALGITSWSFGRSGGA